MSAWDISGAVVWGLCALSLWSFLLFAKYEWTKHSSWNALSFILALIGSTLGAVFCIARLHGAHA